MKRALLVLALSACSGEPTALAPAPIDPSCEEKAAAALSGVEVAAVDLDGYPPYALDGCRALLVNAAGALVLEDFATSQSRIVAAAELRPLRPGIAGELAAWEEEATGVVRVLHQGDSLVLTGPFARAAEPRVARDAVVFTGFTAGDVDADVYLFNPETGAIELVGGGVAEQRFADVSATHVAYSDFSEDPLGRYDPAGGSLADVVVVDRSSGQSSRLTRAGKQAFPMLGASRRVLYLEWVGVHPVPKLEQYFLQSSSLDALGRPPALVAEVATDPPAVRPVARGALVEWVERTAGAAALLRAAADGSSEKVAVTGLEGLHLHAPAASDELTLLATRAGSGAPVLKALSR